MQKLIDKVNEKKQEGYKVLRAQYERIEEKKNGISIQKFQITLEMQKENGDSVNEYITLTDEEVGEFLVESVQDHLTPNP